MLPPAGLDGPTELSSACLRGHTTGTSAGTPREEGARARSGTGSICRVVELVETDVVRGLRPGVVRHSARYCLLATARLSAARKMLSSLVAATSSPAALLQTPLLL